MPDQPQLVFDDGAAYERLMGDWSRRVGTVFLDWLRPAPDLSWLDVGCGSGAFSDLILSHADPKRVTGIDPSLSQLDYARKRAAGRPAEFLQGDATTLPFEAGSFDAAVMALVIFFVPDPTKAVREMARVVRPGGLVASYSWDILGGGLPTEMFHVAFTAMGLPTPMAPHPEAAAFDALREVWLAAGLVDAETREITVQRDFASFDEFWTIYSGGPLHLAISALSAGQVDELRSLLRQNLTFGTSGEVKCSARATAIKGRLPL